MKATTKILKGIFLEGHTMAESIILLPLSIIEIIFYVFYSFLEEINIQFMTSYILEIIIKTIMVLNIWAIVFQNKYKGNSVFILLILTYPIFAEFPEVQLRISCLKITLFIAWITEVIKEYIFFDNSNKFFSRNMIVIYTMICMMSELGINYMILIIFLLLMMVNLINTSKIR